MHFWIFFEIIKENKTMFVVKKWDSKNIGLKIEISGFKMEKKIWWIYSYLAIDSGR